MKKKVVFIKIKQVNKQNQNPKKQQQQQHNTTNQTSSYIKVIFIWGLLLGSPLCDMEACISKWIKKHILQCKYGTKACYQIKLD